MPIKKSELYSSIWTLPDVASAFLGVLFTLQSLVVAAAGLVLTGVTALIAFSISRKS
jgi:hypothetical protein